MRIVHWIEARTNDGYYPHPRVPFRYDTADPFAVTVTFTDDDDVPWTFDRGLLAEGLDGLTGLGDVSLWPDGDRLMYRMSNDDEAVTFSFPAESVRWFLAETYKAVPAGSEIVDLSGLAELLGGAW